ncbi:hypothetical protein [Clostridium butyricum]|uniref:hypothetical protein n=1 Tax=Clostridium butyricum TaxID=1492 RepID=UPI00374F78A1
MEDQEVKDTTSNETTQKNTTEKSVNNDVQTENNQESNTVSNNNEEKFSQQQYLDNAKALGHSAIAVRGAFFNCEKKELSKTEFDKLMKDFLGKKVE